MAPRELVADPLEKVNAAEDIRLKGYIWEVITLPLWTGLICIKSWGPHGDCPRGKPAHSRAFRTKKLWGMSPGQRLRGDGALPKSRIPVEPIKMFSDNHL